MTKDGKVIGPRRGAPRIKYKKLPKGIKVKVEKKDKKNSGKEGEDQEGEGEDEEKKKKEGEENEKEEEEEDFTYEKWDEKDTNQDQNMMGMDANLRAAMKEQSQAYSTNRTGGQEN